MLSYDHEKTRAIVNRLGSVMQLLRTMLIVLFIVSVAMVGAVAARLLDIPVYAGLVVGVFLGFVLGAFGASIVSLGIEWMAQLLVAQGEIIAAVQTEPDVDPAPAEAPIE